MAEDEATQSYLPIGSIIYMDFKLSETRIDEIEPDMRYPLNTGEAVAPILQNLVSVFLRSKSNDLFCNAFFCQV